MFLHGTIQARWRIEIVWLAKRYCPNSERSIDSSQRIQRITENPRICKVFFISRVLKNESPSLEWLIAYNWIGIPNKTFWTISLGWRGMPKRKLFPQQSRRYYPHITSRCREERYYLEKQPSQNYCNSDEKIVHKNTNISKFSYFAWGQDIL
jgi:hypothetical protein